MRFRERHVEHRADADRRARLAQDLLDVRHEVVRHRDVDRRIELDALDRRRPRRVSISTDSLRCALSACRTKRSSRTMPVPRSASSGGSSRTRMLRPRSVATRTMASAATPSVSISAPSRRIASRALLPSIVREMIDAGVDVDAAAVAVGAVMVGAVVHRSSAGIPARLRAARSPSRGRRRCSRSSSARWRRISP